MPLLSFSPVGIEELKFHQELNQEVLQFRLYTFYDSTKSTYGTYRNSYFWFCHLTGYEPVPATTTLICQYAAFLACTLKATSIRNYLNIINLLHKELGLDNPLTNNWPLKSLLVGIKHVKGGEVSQKFPIFCLVSTINLTLTIALMLHSGPFVSRSFMVSLESLTCSPCRRLNLT